MKSQILSVMVLLCCTSALGQQAIPTSLPSQKLGPEDLIQIQVFNFPEFSRVERVSAEGTIKLPLVKQPISVLGKLPSEVETIISDVLRDGELVVNPSVTVSVLEYGSRPISVAGAVRNPIIFQAIGRVTLVDAIIKAGGLSGEAGPEILINRRTSALDGSQKLFTQHVNARNLLGEDGNGANLVLAGGEEIRVPLAGKVYVLGNVKSSGAFPVTDNSDTTVLKVLSLAGGVTPYTSAEAYIIRRDEVSGTKHRIPIDLKGILKQTTPDFPLLADDIFFVADDTKRRQTALVLDRLVSYTASVATSIAIYTAIK